MCEGLPSFLSDSGQVIYCSGTISINTHCDIIQSTCCLIPWNTKDCVPRYGPKCDTKMAKQ